MSKLVFCSYNLIDQNGIPGWVSKLVQNPLVQKEKWAVYNPILGFTGNLESSLALPAALSIQQVPPVVVRNFKALKLDPMLLSPLGEVLPRLKAADESPSIDVAFKSLYVLLRSDIMLVDLNQAGHGESSQETVYAYLSGVPVIGVAHRFILSPWMINKLNAVIFPRTSDEIVQQVLAHDHKTTAMLEHYREEQQEAERQAIREEVRKERAGQRTTGKTIQPIPDSEKTPPASEPEKTLANKAKRKKKKARGIGDGGQPGSDSV